METMQSDSRRVVVVLGAGRSGTSLMMQILVAMGMQVSKNLIPANISNPEGFFEDADIKEIHAGLISSLGSFAYIPLLDDWMSSEPVKTALPTLKRALKVSLDASGGVFGLKDPRMNMLLPLWMRVFNQLSVVPRFVLAVRTPDHVVASMVRQYNDSPSVAELAWLTRSIEALEHTGLDCFIAHYEDLLLDQMPLAQALLQYTGLDQDFKGNLSDVLANTLKPNLNRASKDEYRIQNPYVTKLYEALKQCHGADFDRDRLMTVVKECRHAMEGFKGWYQLAHETKKKLANTQARLESVSAEVAKVNALEARIKEFEKGKQRTKELGQQVNKLLWQLESFETWNS